MKKWHMIIDVKKCEDCNNCFLACKDEYVDNDFLPYSVAQPKHIHRWMNIMRHERGQCPMVDVAFLPIPCQHCDEAPCVMKSRDGAVYKKDDGIVIIDPIKAKGQKDIVETCPYGAIWWNEARDVAQKCTLCSHLLDNGWKEPRCVQACPTGALRVVRCEETEMEQIIKNEKLEIFHPEYKTTPNVYYKNLHRFFKCFLGGNVAIKVASVIDCAEGARVTLFKESRKIDEQLTDNYGDFKFDNLEKNSGKYNLEVFLAGYEKKRVEIDLSDSKNAGTILL